MGQRNHASDERIRTDSDSQIANTDAPTDRQTDRKTDRQTGRQTDRQTEKQTNERALERKKVPYAPHLRPKGRLRVESNHTNQLTISCSSPG